jgi:guanosine-3',5'-bis(diphosphate) 3'-pyrophosphohydrolase
MSVADTHPVLLHHLLSLREQMREYLSPEQIADVERAFVVGEAAHRGQTRKSGEPYITHPVEVARILAEMHLDSETICAAILHDTLEDTELSKPDIEAEFGPTVAALVDGVTKLDQVEFETKEALVAESFRKMVLAMANDLRVILIKLADRLHNMRTIGAQKPESRRRIARETLEIYAPIAQRLGMNRLKNDLQDLGFRALYPGRYSVLEHRARLLAGNRKEFLKRIAHQLEIKLKEFGIPHSMVSRMKTPYSIYKKMLVGPSKFNQVMDVYGIRIVTDDVMHCYMAIGAVHSVFKPVETRFKDMIAIPKVNGYQSLHTVLVGPNGAPIEVQIRTRDMDVVAERGVAAHWIYKVQAQEVSNATMRAREWVATLLEQQKQSGNSMEFLEHVRVDLFPDEVYVFTPKGKILALPKNASCIDFAYAVHSSVGDHAVMARIDGLVRPLKTRLMSGQKVEIITAKSAAPKPEWLEWVVTNKARSAVRHWLKHLRHQEAVELGQRMLARAIDDLGSSWEALDDTVLDQYLADHRLRRLEDLLSDIALGSRMPTLVARQLLGNQVDAKAAAQEVLRISGQERGVVGFGNCCHPIPGDAIVGFLSANKGFTVHRHDCPNMPEMRKSQDRLVRCAWDEQVDGDFRVAIKVIVSNRPGVLATVAASIADAKSNIENVEYLERDLEVAGLVFTIEVRGLEHLLEVLKRVRRAESVREAERVF